MQETNTPIVEKSQSILSEVRKVVVGKDHVLLWVLAAILSNGHILLEDIPGVGKTTMAVAFSKVLGLSYNRVQFTPDVLPSDITGYSIIDQASGTMVYRPGSVLCNLFLADELNRATSRTQSALLEAMEEGQITVDGTTHKLPAPFVVIATQNPAGAAGTQLLPDSQIDRFALRLSLGYPGPEDEVTMLLQRQGTDPMTQLAPVISLQELVALQKTVAQTHVSPEIAQYVVDLIHATRQDAAFLRGASPRATLATISLAKAIAQLRGRDYVVPKDVQEVFCVAVAHRLTLSPKGDSQGLDVEGVLKTILGKVRAPKLR